MTIQTMSDVSDNATQTHTHTHTHTHTPDINCMVTRNYFNMIHVKKCSRDHTIYVRCVCVCVCERERERESKHTVQHVIP